MNRFFDLLITTLIAGLVSMTMAAEVLPNAMPGFLDLGDGVRLELVSLREGTFLQGSPSTERGRNDDETRRTVRITRAFSIGKHPVTRRQFERFVQETRYKTEAEKGASGGFGWNGTELQQQRRFHWRDPGFPQTGEHPVTLVTWNDAQEFNRWLSRRTGLAVQLPTEAQWEYAARAGTEHAYPGADEPEAVSWHQGNAGNSTHAVGLKLPNAWGLADMGGSVAEWCRDWYGPYSADPVDDPEATRPSVGDKPRRVLRGGSWLRDPRHCRVAARGRSDPGSRNADIGFRIVVSPGPIAQATDPTPAHAPVSPSELPRETPSAESEPRQTGPDLADRDGPPNGRISWSVNEFDSTNLTPSPWPSDGSRIARFIPPMVLALIAILVVLQWVRLLMRSREEPRTSAWKAAPRIQRPPPPIERDPPSAIRILDDGFWLPRNAATVGATVEYEYLLDGRRFTDHVVFEPNTQGQFVYTGSRPTDIRFTTVPPRHEEILPSSTVMSGPDSGFISPTPPTDSLTDDMVRVAAGVGGAALGWHAVRGRNQHQSTPHRPRNPAAY